MKKLETYGLNICLSDLKATARATCNYGLFSPAYDEVFYDTHTGEVWSVYQYSLGQDWETVYRDPGIIKIGNFTRHVTQQQLIDCIKARVDEIR